MEKALIQAELKRLHSPDTYSLEAFKPDGPFGILVQAMIGPVGVEAEESFDIVVCTAEWFGANMKGDITPGRHFLFVKRFDYTQLSNFIGTFCNTCTGASWSDVANKLGRLGKWEFEDYIS